MRTGILGLIVFGLGACAVEGDVASIQQRATVCADGPTVPGIDVSKWQGDIDWPQVAGSGVEFAFIRVSDGLDYVDARFDDNWAETKANGILRGAYQFFRSDEDPLAQAQLFVDKVGSPGAGDLPPVIDIESTDGQSPDTIVARAKIWLDYVEASLGVRPIVYTGRYFWNGSMDGHPGLADYQLWIPQWGPECPNVMEPWEDWLFFQSSATGSVPGIHGDVDIDVFNGDRAALEALVETPAVEPCGSVPASGGVVDDADPCFEAGGKREYIRDEEGGFGGGLKWTYATDFEVVSNFGLWHLDFEREGRYRLEVFTPAPHAQSRRAAYQVAHGARTDVVEIDQTAVDGWAEVGVFEFEVGGAQWVRVDDNTGESYEGDARRQLAFDAVRLTPIPDGSDVPPDSPTDDPGAGGPVGPVAGGCRVSGRSGSLSAVGLIMALALVRRRRR